MLRRLFGELKGDLEDFEAVHIEDILSSLDKPVGTRLSLPENIILKVEYDAYYLGRRANECNLSDIDGEHSIIVPGETGIPGWRITTKILNRTDIGDLDTVNSYWAYLDADLAGKTLWVRARRSGDRFQPLGLVAPKSLKEFFVNARVPQNCRARTPLVIAESSEIAWVVGWRIGERFKVRPETQRVLAMQIPKGYKPLNLIRPHNERQFTKTPPAGSEQATTSRLILSFAHEAN